VVLIGENPVAPNNLKLAPHPSTTNQGLMYDPVIATEHPTRGVKFREM
jgi:hypothetical protein